LTARAGAATGPRGREPRDRNGSLASLGQRLIRSDAISPASSEIARPWKIGSARITTEPATTASAVSSIGRNRTAPATFGELLYAEFFASCSPVWQ